MKKTLMVVGALALLGVSAMLGGIAWFEFTPSSETCVKCHEIRAAKENWAHAAHRDVDCKACHGGSVEALADNTRRLVRHVFTAGPHEPRLNSAQVERMTLACAKCHEAEHSQWARSGHGEKVAKYLLDEKWNAQAKPADQCLKCHGMYLEGDLETLLKREWPHTFKEFRDPTLATRSAIPCLACHQMHAIPPAPGSTNFTASAIAFYSHADKMSFMPGELYARKIVAKDGSPVKVTADNRARLCLQCHAANAEGLQGSSDDRTPIGKHAGISCLACHRGHDLHVGDTCGSCHEKCTTVKDMKEAERIIHGKNHVKKQ